MGLICRLKLKVNHRENFECKDKKLTPQNVWCSCSCCHRVCSQTTDVTSECTSTGWYQQPHSYLQRGHHFSCPLPSWHQCSFSDFHSFFGNLLIFTVEVKPGFFLLPQCFFFLNPSILVSFFLFFPAAVLHESSSVSHQPAAFLRPTSSISLLSLVIILWFSPVQRLEKNSPWLFGKADHNTDQPHLCSAVVCLRRRLCL